MAHVVVWRAHFHGKILDHNKLLKMAEFTLETSNPSWTGFSSETSFPS